MDRIKMYLALSMHPGLNGFAPVSPSGEIAPVFARWRKGAR
jgi:hypothetical protein